MHIAIKILESKRKRIVKAYKTKIIKSSTYRRFYSTLREYYMKNGDDVKVGLCFILFGYFLEVATKAFITAVMYSCCTEKQIQCCYLCYKLCRLTFF